MSESEKKIIPENVNLRLKNMRTKMKEYREANSLNQSYMESRNGITQDEMCRFESGERIPTLVKFIEIADATGMTPDKMLGYNKK